MRRTPKPTASTQAGLLLNLRLEAVRPNPRNPRKHSAAQVKAIARSIDSFGFGAPLLIDRDYQIVAGHGRLAAAKLLGLDTVPAICLEHLSKSQATAYMLADNKLTDRSSWDDDLLAQHLKELSELDLDFDLEAVGFELPELDLRIQSLSDNEDADEDEVFLAAGPAVSRTGDLWHLGDHRIYCGNALEPLAYEAVLAGSKANAVFTDPPYNVKIDGHVCGSGAIKHREFAMGAGEMSPARFTTFLQTFICVAEARVAPGAVTFVCMDWRHMNEISNAAAAAGLTLLNVCVWVKTNGGMGSLYRSRHELIFVFRSGGAPHVNNVQLGRFGRNRSNVWHYEGTNSFGSAKIKNARVLHPTVKPVSLVADAILDVTKLGDVVLDPFLGSGTAILAAERTGRCGRGIELDPLYVDTAILRWQQRTGGRAHLACGQTFAEASEARRSA